MPISSARRTCGSSQVLVPAPGEVVRGITGRSRTSGIGFGSQQQHFIPATKTLPLRSRSAHFRLEPDRPHSLHARRGRFEIG